MQRHKRRWWTRGITWLSGLVVLAAAISGLFQLAVLATPGYREQLSQRVSEVAGRPIKVGDVQLAWRWLWPQLQLRRVQLLSEDGQTPLLEADRLRLGFAAADLLRGELIPARIDLEGLALEFDLDADNQLRLRGFPASREPPDWRQALRQLQRFERLRVERVAVRIHDVQRPRAAVWAFELTQADLRINREPQQGLELRAELAAPDLLAEHLKLRVGMSGAFDQPEQWRGRWTLDAENLKPAPTLLARLPHPLPLRLDRAQLSASGDWQPGAPGETRVQLEAAGLDLAGRQPLHWTQLLLKFDYQPQAGGGRLHWEGPVLSGARGAWPASAGGRLAWQRAADGNLRLEGGADFLRLDDLAPWLALSAGPESKWSAAQLASLRGEVRELEGRYEAVADGGPHYAVAALLEGIAFGVAGERGFGGLGGQLSADETGGRFALRGDRARVQLPQVFPAPLLLDRLGAQLSWTREDSGWRLRSPDLDVALLGGEGKAELDLRLPADGSPQLQLKARIKAADAARLKPLMPLRWGEGLKNWLDHSIVRGRVTEGDLLIDGPLADFPFHDRPTGRWALDLDVADARLDYQRDWPGVDRLRARLHFAGNGLSFEADRGIISGVEVQGAKGSIADFASSPLVIDGRAYGEAANYYDFLRGSPLAARLAGLIGHTQGEGAVATTLHLEIPLHSNLGQKTVAEGEVVLDGNRLRVEGLDEPVEGIAGSLRFGNHVAAEGLSGSWYGRPVQASIVTNADGSDELRARGRIDLDVSPGVAARYVPAWVLERLDGDSDWNLSLPLGGPQNGRVTLTSDLRGVRSRLPVPLAKAPDEPLPLQIRIGSDETAPLRLQLDAPGRMALALRFAREAGGLQARGIGIRLGGGEALAPTQDGYAIDGRAEHLDVAAWLGMISASEGAGLNFLGGRFSLAHLQGLGYELPEVSVKVERDGGGDWHADLGGDNAAGTLAWLRGGGGSQLRGRFERLALRPLPAPPKPTVPPAETPPAPADPARNPAQLPTVDFEIAALRIGGKDFGRLRASTERIADGQRLSQLDVDGGLVKLQGEGEWRRQQGQSTARSKFEISSPDLAAGLDGLGFAQTLSGEGRFDADLRWAPSAAGLSWTQAQGPVALTVRNGALRTVDPGGTSRVLGLLNFYALPRRLTLDFRDVASKGLNFSAVEGHFQLGDGNARTSDLIIRSPSLRIEVKGRVGLAARDYDQRVTVYPDVSGISLGALLLGGASLATGPLLPLMAVVANQVLDKPLGEVTQLDYQLTGSWENPEIKRVEEAAATAAPSAKPAVTGDEP